MSIRDSASQLASHHFRLRTCWSGQVNAPAMTDSSKKLPQKMEERLLRLGSTAAESRPNSQTLEAPQGLAADPQ